MTNETIGLCVLSTHTIKAGGHAGCRQMRFGEWVYLHHRLAWIDANGRLPEPGKVICHTRWHTPGKSHPRHCIEPTHLYEGTHRDNVLDSVADGTHKHSKSDRCPNRHEYTPETTIITKTGGRRCTICKANGRKRANRRRREKYSEDRSDVVVLPPTGKRIRCTQGHPYDEENTRMDQGRRKCRICTNARSRARYARRKAEREAGG